MKKHYDEFKDDDAMVSFYHRQGYNSCKLFKLVIADNANKHLQKDKEMNRK